MKFFPFGSFSAVRIADIDLFAGRMAVAVAVSADEGVDAQRSGGFFTNGVLFHRALEDGWDSRKASGTLNGEISLVIVLRFFQ